jgi:hypothetical protein
MNTFWAKPPDIVVFTGGALAREAGFAPFDPAGGPARLRLEDIVTSDGFARDVVGTLGGTGADRAARLQ